MPIRNRGREPYSPKVELELAKNPAAHDPYGAGRLLQRALGIEHQSSKRAKKKAKRDTSLRQRIKKQK